jgi:hypothetical protein
MDADRIFDTLNRHNVQYMLIGGLNFMLRHAPVLTYDVDIWIKDTSENRERCEAALSELAAEWGPSDDNWGPVAEKRTGWLGSQGVFCLLSPSGAIDIFRSVRGLGEWDESQRHAVAETTANGVPYQGISDDDMLRCQLALDESQRRQDRVSSLSKILGK